MPVFECLKLAEQDVVLRVSDLWASLEVVQAVVAFDLGAQELDPGLIRQKLGGLQNPAPCEGFGVKAERGLRR